jgi:fructokinase
MHRIGVDIGGTKIQAVALDAGGAVVHEARIGTPPTYDGLLAAVATLVQQAGEGTVGIGAPGSSALQTGFWRNANIVACNGRPFHTDLQQAIGREIRTGNDANCFALSEAAHGAARGRDIVAFLTIGTGLGGGIVIGGRLITGAHGEAAEFGHTGLPWLADEDWPPPQCYCGKRGCVETYVSGTGLARDYLLTNGQELTGPDIIEAARRGDTRAAAALTRLQHRLARTCANIVNMVDPNIFVMGGGMATLPELVEDLPPLIAQYTFSRTATPAVVRAMFSDSGARGAALLWA